MTVSATLKSHPQAAAWIVKEARERVPAVVDVPDDATLPDPLASAGEVITLEPPQVVGSTARRAARSSRTSPTRACARGASASTTARSVPETCECGASLAELRRAAQVA